ncbi:MAG: hypothetical protein L0Z62_30610 [Gemmataceae bacterium]|nr:hypothetical protein [Gemmataceae bacterium]
MPQPFPKSPSYEAVIRGLLRMHQLTIAGQDESDEADALRESMNEPWEGLSAVERERVTGLSKDLYTISDQPAPAPEQMNPQAQGKLIEAFEARERGEWDRALELLRRWGKYIPTAMLSYLRATTWQGAGDLATAAVFFAHASHLEPANENYQAMLLNVLKITAPADAAARAEAILQESDKRSPVVVIQAADVLYGVTRKMSDLEAAPVYKRLIGILEQMLPRMKESEDVADPSRTAMALMLLATCYEGLGETRQAYEYFSRAIPLDPTNDALLFARGKLVYGTSPAAPADFEQAIQLGSPLVWPYFYMAHYYLANNRFEECRSMCERALHKPASVRVQSELCEFLGISLTALGYPEPVIRRAFENAIRVDPTNDRARRNLERFNAALAARAPQPKDWERPSDASIRLSGQQEVRSGPALYERRNQCAMV